MNVDFNERDKQLRMAILLGLSAPPSKELLLSEIVKKQIMSFVFPELRNVYQILEVDFHPLDLCSKMMPVFQFLQQKPELQIYVKPLQSITLSRLLFQLSKAYEVVQISKLEALAPFVTLPQVERAIVLAVQQRRLQITIDHQNSSLIFGRSVDPFDFDSLRNELTKLSKKLLKASQMMYPQMLKTERDQQQKLVAGIVKEAESEHKALLQRKQFIEKRKVYLKNLKDEEEREREEKLEKLREKRRKLEREAQERQQQKREEEIRKRKEEEEKKEKQVKLIKELEQAGLVTETTINAVAAKTGKKKSKLNIEKDVNVETIMEIKREELEKQRREKEKRLTDEAKQLDFLERARRLEEIPLLKKHYEQEKKEDRVYYEQMVLEAQENYKKEIEYIKATKAVIEKMFADKNDFIDNVVMRKRRAAYEKLLEAYNKKKEEARRAWLARRELIKKEVERIEEEKRQAQLEEKRKREEEELRRQEELKKKKEREEEEEKLRRITELQQKREREAEEKMRQQKEAALKSLAQQETEKKPYKPPSSRWESLTEKSPFGEKKRFEEKSPFGAKKRFEDERSPFGSRRKFDSEKSPFSSEKSPFGDKEGGRRRFDDNKPAFGDRKKREDESDKNKDASPSNIGGRWR
jgi:translation initiation factor 3 subunit A